MHDLRASVRQTDGDVGAVRADVHAVLADGVAAQAALALAAGLARCAQDALAGDSLGLCGMDRSRAAQRITGSIDAGNVRAEGRTALRAERDAVVRKHLLLDLLADCGDHEVARQLDRLAGRNRAAASGGIRLAEAHLLTRQDAVFLLDGRGQLEEVHAILHGKLQLLRIGGHKAARSAVDERHGRRAAALCHAGSIHGGVAAADDGDMAERLVRTGLALLHPADDTADVAGDVQLAGLPCAGGIENVGIAHFVQLFDGGSLGIQADLCAVGLHKGDIAVNGLVRDAERRDDMADDAAELAGALEDGAGHACTAEEVGRSNAGRAAADDGSALAGNGSRADDGCHSGIDALLGRQQLGSADQDGILIEIAGALAHAAVRADRAGDERQGVALRDEGQRLVIQALAAQLEILGDVLCDGAAAAAGGGVAIEPGHLFLGLARGQRLDRLAVVRIRAAGG